tara:strand:+ start:3687 stop:4268 length:582 start_codon:yes stop_codon:yes gene_type:complete
MYICNPKDNVVLILSHFWTPINITSAKEGIKKLMSPDIKAISNGGEPLCWEDWIDPTRACYYDNQPFLRSKKNIFPVPTILLTSSNWSYKCQEKPNIDYLYSRYKGRCQICGKKLSVKKMSIEHILPKSKGGDNGWMNLTMTCKPCNAKKGNIYPYADYKGSSLKAPKPLPYFHSFLRHRDEWAIFLFKNLPK